MKSLKKKCIIWMHKSCWDKIEGNICQQCRVVITDPKI